jgi:hypothetical protein
VAKNYARVVSMKMKGALTAMTKKWKTKAKKHLPAKSGPGTATPTLRFSPTAWAKLLFLRDYGDTEVGGFGITSADDLLFVEDVQLVKQACSWTNVAFEDESVADFFDQQVDLGRRLEQFARLWVHTHPGDCPRPSMTDEETFDRVFGRSDWAAMFILACDGQSYARLRFNVGPGADLVIPVGIDYSRPFDGCDTEAWEQEYLSNVQPAPPVCNVAPGTEPVLASPFDDELTDDWRESWYDYVNDDETVEGFVT